MTYHRTVFMPLLAVALMLSQTAFCAEDAPAGHPQIPASGESAGHQEAAPITGTAAEVLYSGGYTYIRLEKDGKSTWVAVPEAKVKVGSEVSVEPGEEMANFPSKTLNRTFERIIFSNALISGAAKEGQAVETKPISGRVLQTINSGGYTYVLLKPGKGEKRWLAIPENPGLPTGAEITFQGGVEMTNFESKTLKRTFDRILFSQGPMKPTGKEKKGKAQKQSSGSKAHVVKSDEKIKVEKATGPNAYTIGELYAASGKLSRKKVSIRGKVIKVSSGIMNRNWVHLQDGSGDPRKGTHNLVVTTNDVPAVGDIVTATGILAKDKDFGGGYRYAVILEKADIVIQ
ncbi:MAG: DNA-binding protein [Geobacter sp.]|nr:DNA-binding protein [Geobacter sp.]